MPGSTYTKTQLLPSAYETSTLQLKKASVITSPPVEAPKEPSSATLLNKFLESHRALENHK